MPTFWASMSPKTGSSPWQWPFSLKMYGINQQRNNGISLVSSSTHQTYCKNHVCCLFTHPSYIFYVHILINIDKGTIPWFWSPLFRVLRSWVKADDSKVKCEGHTPKGVCEEKFSRPTWLVFVLFYFCSKLFSAIQTESKDSLQGWKWRDELHIIVLWIEWDAVKKKSGEMTDSCK